MPQLFESTTIGNMTLANRFVRSATWEGMASDDGLCTPQLTDWMVALAAGEVGLIITGHAYVSREGQAGPWQLNISEDRCIDPLRTMVERVHEAGGKICLQLAHAGCHAATKLSGRPALGPSPFQPDKGPGAQEMTLADIDRTAAAFTAAARRARQTGFDAVQFHAAHGYLLSQFLSPFYNRRTDEFGGTLENRARLLERVALQTRERLGTDFPLLVKMNSEDFLDPGLTQDEMLEVAARLQAAGIDAIELSGGTISSGRRVPVRKGTPARVEDEVYYREAARRFKQAISIPLLLVGGIRSYEVAERLVEEGLTDYVSMSRPLIREPGLIRRWRRGDRAKAACDSDNLCFRPAMSGKGIHCVVEKRRQKK